MSVFFLNLVCLSKRKYLNHRAAITNKGQVLRPVIESFLRMKVKNLVFNLSRKR